MMNDLKAIAPGTQVWGAGGMVGTVERLDSAAPGSSTVAQYVLIHGADGQHYRLPMDMVGDVRQEQGQGVVVLRGDASDLRLYIFEGYVDEADTVGTARRTTAEEWGIAEDEQTLRIPLAAEELIVAKQPISWGSVRVHKRVSSEEQSQSVSLYHEEAVIEHISPDQYDANAPVNPDEIIVPIVEEQLFVEKRSVIKEYIRIRKTLVTHQQDVRETVRREYVEIEEAQPAGSTATPVLRRVASGAVGQEGQPRGS